MTQTHGLFTIQTWLTLVPQQRARLERLVREQGGDLADTLSRIVAERRLDQLPSAPERPAGENLPVRVFLTPEQRDAFEGFVAANKIPLPNLLSQIVAERLAELPDAPAREPAPAAPTAAETRKLRSDLARLRAQRDAAGATAPAWLHAYIAELEDELRG
jgi:hypothetical protein